MEVALKTHIGHVRQVNEDYAEIIINEQQIMLALLADGMGGHQAGDVASRMAINIIKNAFLNENDRKDKQGWNDWLLQIIEDANRMLYQYAAQHAECAGMGTTLVALLVCPDFYLVAHVGDSRLYRVVDNHLQIVTNDHSLVNELVQSGQITEEEARNHPQRNIITRALGTEEAIEVDQLSFTYSNEQYFLICTDGLSNYVQHDEMEEILNTSQKLEQKADSLLQKALDAGGEDNITFILIQVDGEEI